MSSTATPTPAPPKPTRAEINRANAQKSTGPRTPEGKAASRFNALTHGLTSREVPLIANEDPDEFAKFRQQIFRDLAPVGPEETQLAETIVTLHWRIRRIPSLEAQLLTSASATPKDLSALSLHEHRLTRLLHQARASLTQLQTARRARDHEDMAQAAALLNFHEHKKHPFNPADFGFVFSTADIRRYINRCAFLAASQLRAKETKQPFTYPQWRPRDVSLPATSAQSAA